MKINRQIIYFIIILALTLIIFETTDIDILVQDHFYNFSSHRWIVDKHDPTYRLFFYTGVKIVLIIFGIFVFFGLILSFRKAKWKNYKKKFLLLLLAMPLIPSSVAGLKEITNVYCPSQIVRYGSDKPYVKLFEKYPSDFKQKKRGKGFPAAHASGGFALVVLFFVFDRKRYKVLGLCIGVTLGWIMGLYQMLKGAHYLSHTVVSMIIAWILSLLLYKIVHSKFIDIWLKKCDAFFEAKAKGNIKAP